MLKLSCKTHPPPTKKPSLCEHFCVFLGVLYCFFSCSHILRRMGKIKLKVTTLPRIFSHVVCHLSQLHAQSSSGFVVCPSVPAIAIARVVPTGGPRYYSGSASCL